MADANTTTSKSAPGRPYVDVSGNRSSSPRLPGGAVRADPYAAGLSGVDPLYGQRVEDLNEHDRRQYEEWQARDIETEEKIVREEMRKAELEHATSAAAQRSVIINSARSIKRPSLVAYGAFGFAAVLVDLIDIVETLIGDGGGITWLYEIPVALVFIAFSYFATGQIKKIQSHSDSVASHTAHLRQRIQSYEQKYSKALTMLGKSGAAGAKLARVTTGAVSKARRSPLGRAVIASVGNIIWLIEIFPFQVYGVYTTYKAHTEAYNEGVAALNENSSVASIEAQSFSQSQLAGYEESLAQIQDAATNGPDSAS